MSAPIVDLSALGDARAASYNLQAAKYGIKTARDLVVLVAVNLYLEAVATSSRVEMTHAQFDTAQALFNQAQDLKNAGIVAGIDVLRSQVQLQTQRQRVIAAENDFEKIKLQLARAIGLPVGQPLILTDKIPYAPMPPLTAGAGDEGRALDPPRLSRGEGTGAGGGGNRAGGARRAPAVTALRRRLRRDRPDDLERARHLLDGGHCPRPDFRRRAHDRAPDRGRCGAAPAPG